MTEWLSVKDRPPPLKTPLLFFTVTKNVTFGQVIAKNGFNDYFIEDKVYLATERITHWMHLPAPPTVNNQSTSYQVEYGGNLKCLTSDGRIVNMAKELNRLEEGLNDS